ncbi:MAG: class I SAM-dependent RNA methyltransferase [Lentisphaeria bacterium]|nr:class I SAM-dependent RNA methyltransferase [Lentisphaeria bacterium]
MAEKNHGSPLMNTNKQDSGMEIIEIFALAFGGKAVGRRDNGKVCFVRNAIPGEKVRVRITADKKNYSEGVVTEILTPSPERISPQCPNPCPGCSYAHIPYPMELEWKQKQFFSFAEKAKLQSSPAEFIQPPTGAVCRENWRNKIVLSIEKEKNSSAIQAGYRGEDNQTLIPVKDCLLARKEIREILRNRTWEKESLSCTVQRITFRHTKENGVRILTGKTENALTEELDGFGTFCTGENSFFQINPYMSGKLAEATLETVAKSALNNMIELYCGCGVFSILCTEHCLELKTVGIELDPVAIKYAKQNAAAHGVSERCRFFAGDSATVFRKHYPAGVPKGTLLLIDPPRTGLDKNALELLCRSKADAIVYISCSPDTLFRDLAVLEKSGYRIQKSRLIDMFPTTSHFESISYLQKR